ncbi:MAG TPA: YetF domain-containing protein [Chloroflexota bacterium]|jgi:uncharacterized membrane protein YcaP (DUF421 family)|nr:YetF domain-containing protein [Chloroflexota bacterium]
MLDFEALAAIALRVSVMYVYALAMLRLSGKRSVGQLAGPDVVATIIVGDMFDDIFWSEISLAKGLVGVTTITALHLVAKVIEARSPAAKRILDGDPALMLVNGGLVQRGQARERINDENVHELLRVRGEDDPQSVREARLEVDGTLSVLRFEERKGAQKRDLERLREVMA